MSRPVIKSIWPPNGYTSFPIGSDIIILFEGQVDPGNLQDSIFLYGPDFDVHVGPGLETRTGPYPNRTSYEAALNSPGFQGEVPVSIRIYRVNEDNEILEEQKTYEEDQVEFSRVVVNPVGILQQKTDYTLFITGESSEESINGISSLSVFDAVPHEDNTGTGDILTGGPYLGTTQQTLTLTCTRSGNAGNARFSYSIGSGANRSFNGSYEVINLDAGVNIELFGDSNDSFVSGDSWTILLLPAQYLETTYRTSFTTIFPNIDELPKNISTSPILENDEILEEFKVISVDPPDMSSNVSLKTNKITITFNRTLNPESVNFKSIELLKQTVDGISDFISVPFSYLVSDNKIILKMMSTQE